MVEKETEIKIENGLEKVEVIDLVDKWRFDLGLGVEELNGKKDWGAYWRIDNRYLGQFLKLFFPKKYIELADWNSNLSPKLLLVGPNEKLSWQYHDRRAENWKVVAGNVEIKSSESDVEPEITGIFKVGDGILLPQGIRHRLMGLGEWGLVAEVWTHTDPDNPSDEEDIKRLRDAYGREGTTNRY